MPPGTPGWWTALVAILLGALVVSWLIAQKCLLEIVRGRPTVQATVRRWWAERPVLFSLLAPAGVLLAALILTTVLPLALLLEKAAARQETLFARRNERSSPLR